MIFRQIFRQNTRLWLIAILTAMLGSMMNGGQAAAQNLFGGASYGIVPGFYSGYYGASQIVVADVNGDGIPDIVTANDEYYNGTVSLVFGRGDGGFQPAYPLPVGPSPSCVAVGDFNGDGIPDIAVFSSANYTNPTVNTISLLLGKGGGKFAPAVSQTVTQNFVFLTAADVNGDGRDDLIGTTYGQIVVFPGTAFGLSQTPIVTNCDTGASLVAAADLNGDGKLDLVQYDRLVPVNSYSTMTASPTLFYGNGDGSFQSGQPLATVTPPNALTIRDVNGDGKPDLIAASGQDVEVFLNAGGGKFLQPAVYPNDPASVGTSAAAIVAADINGDGKQDIVTLNTNGDLNTLLSNGDGTFRGGLAYAVSYPQTPYNALAPVALYIGDLNGDGKADALFAGGLSATFYAGNGNGFNAAIHNALTNIQAIADFTGDHKPDALSLRSDNSSFAVSPGNGDGTFGSPIVTATGLSSIQTAVGDFNGDGKPDVAVLGTNSAGAAVTAIYTGNGDGTFTLLHSYPISGASYTFAIGAADFNGDGKTDLLVFTGVPFSGYAPPYQYGYTASCTLLTGDGASGFTALAAQKIGDAIYGINMTVGDINADGIADFALCIAAVNSDIYTHSSTLVKGFGGRKGVFSLVNYGNYSTYQATPAQAAFALGDFNGNGHNDLVTNVITVTGYGNGGVTGTSLTISPDTGSAPVFGLPTAPFGSMVTGDFNGDGQTDLLIGNRGGLYYYAGNGDGTVSLADVYNLSVSPAFAADLNDDGKLDVVGPGAAVLNVSAPAPADAKGKLTLEGLAANANAQLVRASLRDSGGNVVLTRAALAGPSGAITLYGIPPGTYTLHLKADRYLAVNVPLFVTAGGSPTFAATLPAGDANNDNVCDTPDFNILAGAFGSVYDPNTPNSVTGYDPAADFNGDGVVDTSDFNLLVGSFGQSGAP